MLSATVSIALLRVARYASLRKSPTAETPAKIVKIILQSLGIHR
jgi:hypothetical protein